MDEVLGLVALAGYIAAVIGLAAAITFAVVRIFPTERVSKKDEKTAEKPEKAEPQAGNGGSGPAGSLFRRSKRGR